MNAKKLTRGLTPIFLGLLFNLSAHAVTAYDLTAVGSSATINGASFIQGPVQPAGSGAIDSIVRVGAANQTTVQGYNTTANNVFDTGNTDTFNHEVTVGEVGFTDVGGADKMRFLLDINQNNSQTGDSLLNLDEVQVFISTSANQSVETFTVSGLVDFSNSAIVYWMDQLTDNLVKLEYNNESGSGASDMFLEIPKTLFDPAFASLGLTTNGQKNGAFVYLYSKFGSIQEGSNGNNDGYEEWAYREGAGSPISSSNGGGTTSSTVPEPGTVSLLGIAMLGGLLMWRRQRAAA